MDACQSSTSPTIWCRTSPTDGNPKPNVWLSLQKTKGPSDLYVQSNVWQVGGFTGWHTHPGHSLVTVTAGAMTNYDGDDPTCTGKVYTAGMTFVDHGGDHAHMVRNEGFVEATDDRRSADSGGRDEAN